MPPLNPDMKTLLTVSPRYNEISQFIESIPQIFHSQGTLIYKARNEIKNFEVDGLRLTVKHYKKPHIINQIAYSSLRQSKAKRAYFYAQRLIETGIKTPEPVAYIEQYSNGLLTNAYFVSLFETYPHILRELWGYSVEGNEPLLTALASYTANMHNKNIYPVDYSPGNVLFDNQGEGYQFSLLDINRMRFRPVSKVMAARGFRRFHVQPDVLKAIAGEYARLRGYDIPSFVMQTLHHYNAFWKRHEP